VASPPRVLLGNLDPIVRLGMTGVFEQDGIVVVGSEEQPAMIVAEAKRLRPDIIVLPLDSTGTLILGRQVRAAAPDAKVILWARDEDEMQVLDPGSSTPRLIHSLLPEALRRELTTRHGQRERE
jgi:DNA-binding NarL/FixJ family response regulator